MKCEMGTRVRRTAYNLGCGMTEGELGTVVKLSGEGVQVSWDSEQAAFCRYAFGDADKKLEPAPADAAAPSGPVLCKDRWQDRECCLPAGHDGFHRSDLPGVWGSEKQRAAMAAPASEWKFECATCGLKCKTEAVHVSHQCPPAAIEAKYGAARETRGDLQGTVAALRSQLASLEVDNAWLRKECVRLGGKQRGSR